MGLDPRSGMSDTPSKMLRAVKEIESVAPPNEWSLVSPDGRVWRQKPEELMQVLAQHHPLFQTPSFKDLKL